MTIYRSITELKSEINKEKLNIRDETIKLLELLEEVNPCEQSYDLENNSLLVSYRIKINLFNFFGGVPFYRKTRIVGLPISISDKGYYGDSQTVKNIINNKKGLTIVLNADKTLGYKTQTLSNFIFKNKYNSFDHYIDNLRSNYRRRIKKTLKLRNKLLIRKIKNSDFTEDHYLLYRSVMDRTDNPLETLSIEFFRKYNADLYEFRDRSSNKLLAFIQLKDFGESLYFLFCGFKKEDNESYDLYFNMLLKIIEVGIENGSKEINFGQTSEESKLKIGCIEEARYLSIYHSNIVINKILQGILPLFSYKPYKVKHNVFKKGI